ncbi:hypothetical protein HYPSUDRAFT_40837 [Hypholoma sublateritium FD-334 SS-4]|uniref:Protein kinase domain-containing protein n=1 Tax=Hypholoma sublateritium (strain FD-334 SS-4) TaxID=945553 RepID=A0A0D2NVA5_HYPSF|nr:hypothetical protein HYPSUDRAFT_40837 [Hypholoma sublateritium FD-334 SS-4]
MFNGPSLLRRLLPLIQTRMHTTYLTRADKIFIQSIPSPPSWPNIASFSPIQSPPTLQWEECNESKRRLRVIIHQFQDRIIFNRRRMIQWPPSEECILSTLSPSEYFYALMCPIHDFFNQMSNKSRVRTPVGFAKIDLGDSMYGLIYTTADFDRFEISPPMIVLIPDKLFNADGTITWRVEHALRKVLDRNKFRSPSIVITNLTEIAVFFPSDGWQYTNHAFARVPTTHPAAALRVIATACTLAAHRFDIDYFAIPDIEPEIDDTLVHPEGPPQNPATPLLPDEQLFPTCRRNLDFDHATLVRDRERALQFFRWNKHTRQTKSKLVAHPKDTLSAVTHKLGISTPPESVSFPVHPYDASELPPDAMEHLQSIRRNSPLLIAGLADALQNSKSFLVNILDVVDAGSTELGFSTVYRCHITAIDDVLVHECPPLCLKLFDDRFQPLDPDPEAAVPSWFYPVIYAEKHAVNEAAAYHKLRSVQGTVIPWFYGNHQFSLPDGTLLNGLLMEYIDGHTLNSDFVLASGREAQVQMIQSCRHAVRVLNAGDVTQRDWHPRQALIHTNAATGLPYAVFLDFAYTTQTWDVDAPNYMGNYFDVFTLLLGQLGPVAFDADLVLDHFGDPDEWDYCPGSYIGTRKGRKKPLVKRGIFPFLLPLENESGTQLKVRKNTGEVKLIAAPTSK